jgi:hypothetical protein
MAPYELIVPLQLVEEISEVVPRHGRQVNQLLVHHSEAEKVQGSLLERGFELGPQLRHVISVPRRKTVRSRSYLQLAMRRYRCNFTERRGSLVMRSKETLWPMLRFRTMT